MSTKGTMLSTQLMYTENLLDTISAERDALLSENEQLRRVTHISLPTSTMEEAFSSYHRRGFDAGVKQGQAERERLHKQLSEARELLEGYGGGKSEIEEWLEVN